MTSIPGRSWLDPRIDIRASAIDRLGLFASAPIVAGEIIIRWGGRLIDDDALARLQAAFEATGAEYSCAAIDEGRHLQQAADDPLRFGNHSCDPNTWLVGEMVQAARRDIATDEEITVDYATMTVAPGWKMACRCGASVCRDEVRGDDWRSPDSQQRYGEHVSPFIAARIATLRGGRAAG